MSETSIDPKKRFAFGKNWAAFLRNLNEDRIQEASKSLLKNLNLKTLQGKTFLDIGSGSGLFSLAAHRLGAEVYSFDYDEDSVACTRYLKATYGQKEGKWDIHRGSVLDKTFLAQFTKADIVYSWGVLHHTGFLYNALENAGELVDKKGTLFISIYNDQGKASRVWKWIKRTYVSAPHFRKPIALLSGLWLWKFRMAWGLVRYGNPLKYIRDYGKNNRGMTAWNDLVDWVGGYPFEVAKPEEIFEFFQERGFSLRKMKTCGGGLGCNEFVFVKTN